MTAATKSSHQDRRVVLAGARDAGSGGRLLGSSFAVLRNLSKVGEVKVFMVEEGVVTELVKLSQQMEEVRKLGAVELLHSMALDALTLLDLPELALDHTGDVLTLLDQDRMLPASAGTCGRSTRNTRLHAARGGEQLNRLVIEAADEEKTARRCEAVPRSALASPFPRTRACRPSSAARRCAPVGQASRR